jgi:hypothetical protein
VIPRVEDYVASPLLFFFEIPSLLFLDPRDGLALLLASVDRGKSRDQIRTIDIPNRKSKAKNYI